MSRYSREHPDEPEFDIDKFFDKVEERAERRRLAAEADTQTPEEIIAEREQHDLDDLRRAEIESGSEWAEGEDEDE